jgi:hypothetical protein
MDGAVESYLTELARTEHEEPVLVEMEARAAEHGFPIVGRATGRFMELAARAVSARRVMERCRVPFRRRLAAPEVRQPSWNSKRGVKVGLPSHTEGGDY